jgi:outer membrane protein W
MKFKIQMRALLALVVCLPCGAKAGYVELSGNGSYFKYNNGVVGGVQSNTTSKKIGGGIAYRFLANTSFEINYIFSRSYDRFGQQGDSFTSDYVINKTTDVQNLSVSLVIDFADKRSTFRPYMSGGIGYMIRKTQLDGTGTDKATLITSDLVFTNDPEIKSASANGGIGFKYFVADSVAIEIGGTIYATDLDKTEIYLHYAATGGLRIVF